MKPLKALSIRQPWPWVMLRPDLTEEERQEANENGLLKSVENRNWRYPPTHRGQLVIHAGNKFDFEGAKWIQQNFPEIPLPRTAGAFERGGFVGLVNMTDVVTESESRWFFGPLGFVFRDQHPISLIPYPGQLNFFAVPDYIQLKIERVLSNK